MVRKLLEVVVLISESVHHTHLRRLGTEDSAALWLSLLRTDSHKAAGL
jgi:hypothetical protein